jgi:hypothetical protein
MYFGESKIALEYNKERENFMSQDPPHAWELTLDEKKKLLPSVKAEFYSSPHAWETEETTKPSKDQSKNRRGSTGDRNKLDRKPNEKKRLERASSSNTSIFDRLGDKETQNRPKKGEEHRKPPRRDAPAVNKKEQHQEPLGSIFDRLGPKLTTKPLQEQKSRERIVKMDRSPSPTKERKTKTPKSVRKTSSSDLKAKAKEFVAKTEAVTPQAVKEPENELKFIPIEQLDDNIGDWADDVSPMDYTKVPTWN